MRWLESVACVVEKRNGYLVFMRKAERKETVGRLRCRWNSNITICFKEIICEVVDAIVLDQFRVQWWDLNNIVMKFWAL